MIKKKKLILHNSKRLYNEPKKLVLVEEREYATRGALLALALTSRSHLSLSLSPLALALSESSRARSLRYFRKNC